MQLMGIRVVNCKVAKMIFCRPLPQTRVAAMDLITWFDAVHGEIFRSVFEVVILEIEALQAGNSH